MTSIQAEDETDQKTDLSVAGGERIIRVRELEVLRKLEMCSKLRGRSQRNSKRADELRSRSKRVAFGDVRWDRCSGAANLI